MALYPRPGQRMDPKKQALRDRALSSLQERDIQDDAVGQLDQAADRMRGGGQQGRTPTVPRHYNVGGSTPSPEKTTTDDDSDTAAADEADDKAVGELAKMRLEHDKEMEARKGELAAGKARALQGAGARAGLSGMGLSGATSALLSDVGRTQQRDATLALGELGRGQRDEEWQALQRDIALRDLEAEMDEDIDGDGTVAGEKVEGDIGNGDPDDNPKTDSEKKADLEGALAAVIERRGGNGSANDPIGGMGGMSDAERRRLVEAGMTFSGARVEYQLFGEEVYIYAEGSDGSYYKFSVPASVFNGLGDEPSTEQLQSAALDWFEKRDGR